MITPEQARRIAWRFIHEKLESPHEPLAILEDETLEGDYGWVFFYSTKAFVETGDEMTMAVGNVPILVDRKTGEIHLAAAGRIETFIENYRRHAAKTNK